MPGVFSCLQGCRNGHPTMDFTPRPCAPLRIS